MSELFVCAGNALGFGGGARNHTLHSIKQASVNNGLYNGENPELKGAICFEDGVGTGRWFALKADFTDKGSAQEETLYHNLLTKYPLSNNQEYWNTVLANFVTAQNDRMNPNVQTEDGNLVTANTLGALCKAQARRGGALSPAQEQAIRNNKQQLTENIYYTLPDGNIIAHMFAPQCSKRQSDDKSAMGLMYENLNNNDEYKNRLNNSYKDLQNFVDRNNNGIQKVYATGVGAGIYAGGDKGKKFVANELCQGFCKNNKNKAIDCRQNGQAEIKKFCGTDNKKGANKSTQKLEEMRNSNTLNRAKNTSILGKIWNFIKNFFGIGNKKGANKSTQELEAMQNSNTLNRAKNTSILDKIWNFIKDCKNTIKDLPKTIFSISSKHNREKPNIKHNHYYGGLSM